jgi:creatinine amidohydrolase
MGHSIFDDTMVVMNWVEIEKAIKAGAIVLLPSGVLEEHGPHMSLASDIYYSCTVLKLVRVHLEAKGIQSLVGPPHYWGINNVTGSFPGSFTVRKETLKAMVFDILSSFQRWGVNYVFVLDVHGDRNHRNALLEAIREARIGMGIRAYSILPFEVARRLGLEGSEDYVLVESEVGEVKRFSSYADVHAGASEVSFMHRYFPSEVNVELARTLKPTELSSEEWRRWAQGWSDARQVTPLGYNGDPAAIDIALVQELTENEAKNVAGVIEALVKGEYKPPVFK